MPPREGGGPGHQNHADEKGDQPGGLEQDQTRANRTGAPCCVLTDSGTRLARWIKDRQRMALSKVVYSMRPDARDALIHGLRELAAVASKAS